jgi:hypothetical protein
MAKSVWPVLTVALVAYAAASTPSAARWFDYPHSGYCSAGTCNRAGGWRTLNVRACKPEHCRAPVAAAQHPRWSERVTTR